jgi:hypothetical protein
MISKLIRPATFLALFAFGNECAAQGLPEFKVSNPETGDAPYHFGSSTASDGDTLLVGTPGKSSPEGVVPGQIRCYVQDAFGDWGLEDAFTSPVATVDGFGSTVDLSGDTAVVGAGLDDVAGVNAGCVYVFVRSTGVWTRQALLKSHDVTAGDEFGGSVSISGDTLVVGARQASNPLNLSGSVYVFVRTGSTWTQQAELSVPDAAVNDLFGSSVAIDGDTIAAAAPNDDDGGSNSGSIYIFTRTGTIWSQQAKLVAPDANTSDLLGSRLSLSGDTVMAGVPTDDDGGSNTGSVYVFQRTGETWAAPTKIHSSDPTPSRRFGVSATVRGDLALIGNDANHDAELFRWTGAAWAHEATVVPDSPSSDSDFGEGALSIMGDRIAVSDIFDGNTGLLAGAVYLFEESGGVWEQQAKLIVSSFAGEDLFGYSVAISGETLAAGALGDDLQSLGSGSLSIFTRGSSGWSLEASLYADDAAATSALGNAIALTGDSCLVGAESESTSGVLNSGSAYLFRRDGSGWIRETKFVAPDPASSDGFGASVALQGDTAIVGVPNDDDTNNGSGSVFVFVRESGVWTQQAKLHSTIPVVSGYFGGSVSIDGETLVVGAETDLNGGSRTGAAYVFVRTDSAWSPQARLLAESPSSFARYGESVSISGDTMAVGASADDGAASNAGAVYIYTRSGETWAQEARIFAADPDQMSKFGSAVSLSGDTLVVGAPGIDAAYVFTSNDGTWTQRLKINPSDATFRARFGSAVSTDGINVAVGAPENHDPEIYSGTVYTYEIVHTLDFATDGTPGATLTGDTSQNIFHGEFASPVTADPPDGTPFGYWSREGAFYNVANPLAVAGVKSSATYTAVFSPLADAGGWEMYE